MPAGCVIVVGGGPGWRQNEESTLLLEKVNADVAWTEMVQAESPVMATPAALAAATPTLAKAAGFVVGAAAVTGAAYVAYKTAGGSEIQM
jgi:hypothetical protein